MTKLFFNEEAHKYTDDIGTSYTSVTTIIHKYANEFKGDMLARKCEEAGRNPESPSYEKYKGKTAAQIQEEWQKNSEAACDKGTLKHAFIEDALLACTTNEKYPDRMFTIENINDSLGHLDIEKFKGLVGDRFPTIYKAIEVLHSNGFRFFPELAVFNQKLGISGTIDLFCLKDKKFVIIDWKTNRDQIKFESGYWEKSRNGDRTGRFIEKSEKMKAPLFFMPDSTGNHYTLQISGYAWLAEQFGYENINNNMIFQIRDIDDQEHVDMIKLKDFKSWAKQMFEHYAST